MVLVYTTKIFTLVHLTFCCPDAELKSSRLPVTEYCGASTPVASGPGSSHVKIPGLLKSIEADSIVMPLIQSNVLFNYPAQITRLG